MRGGVILIALALVIAYLGVSGRYKCFSVFFNCAMNPDSCSCAGASGLLDGKTVIVKPGPGEPPTAYDPKTHEPVVYDARDYVSQLLPIEAF